MSERANKSEAKNPGAGGAPRNRMEQERRNVMALMSLLCGIASWVPWIVVFMAPLAWGFALVAIFSARKRSQREGTQLAFVGAGLAAASVIVQLAIVGVVALLGHVLDLFTGGPGS